MGLAVTQGWYPLVSGLHHQYSSECGAGPLTGPDGRRRRLACGYTATGYAPAREVAPCPVGFSWGWNAASIASRARSSVAGMRWV